MLTQEEKVELQRISLNVRERVIQLATQGGCFLGASLSCTDLMVYLYEKFLNISKESLQSPSRDFLFLSKGHDVPALYGTLVEKGWIESSRLDHHLKTTDSIYWHPNRNVPGVEFHSGSLGHLLPVAVGVALDCRMRGLSNRVCVIVGDGELNEGSNWEALLVAHAQKLDNLVVIVDRNEFQANKRTEDLLPLEPLDQKFNSFGAVAKTYDGHNFDELEKAFSIIPYEKGRPNVVIMKTVRGKGLPSIEERADRWFCNFSESEIQGLLQELHGQQSATIKSETLIVR